MAQHGPLSWTEDSGLPILNTCVYIRGCPCARDVLPRRSGWLEVITATSKWRDLAPMILRQRLVVEGTRREPITDERIRSYLSRLSSVCGMQALMEPATRRSDTHGSARWGHSENSG